jgi:hypothetical protein
MDCIKIKIKKHFSLLNLKMQRFDKFAEHFNLAE